MRSWDRPQQRGLPDRLALVAVPCRNERHGTDRGSIAPRRRTPFSALLDWGAASSRARSPEAGLGLSRRKTPVATSIYATSRGCPSSISSHVLLSRQTTDLPFAPGVLASANSAEWFGPPVIPGPGFTEAPVRAWHIVPSFRMRRRCLSTVEAAAQHLPQERSRSSLVDHLQGSCIVKAP